MMACFFPVISTWHQNRVNGTVPSQVSLREGEHWLTAHHKSKFCANHGIFKSLGHQKDLEFCHFYQSPTIKKTVSHGEVKMFTRRRACLVSLFMKVDFQSCWRSEQELRKKRSSDQGRGVLTSTKENKF